MGIQIIEKELSAPIELISFTPPLHPYTQLSYIHTKILEQIFQQVEDSRLSVCLGLICRRFYSIHRHIHLKHVPLRVGWHTNNEGVRQFFEPRMLLELFIAGHEEVYMAWGGYL